MNRGKVEFKFESLKDLDCIVGTSYLMDFGEIRNQEDAAIIEGKLLTVFGAPAAVSENYDNSFNYIIRATSDDKRTAILTVYGMGVVHIGSSQSDDFITQAASALIDFVNTAVATDFQRTVYYLDFDLQIDISVKDGLAKISQYQISEEKRNGLFKKLYM